MQTERFHFRVNAATRWLATGAGILATGYGTYAGLSWFRFGRAKRTHPDELLDRFMPDYDVVEHHSIRVAAPAEITLGAAENIDLQQSPIIRWIFKAREFFMGGIAQPEMRPTALRAQVTALGWKVLAEKPGREIVFGAVTQPWLANVVFRPLEPDEFVNFREPGYVKIAWILHAEPIGSNESVFHTETRAKATDAVARQNFRRYWSLVSAGIVMIRWISLRLTKKNAEQLALLAKRRTI